MLVMLMCMILGLYYYNLYPLREPLLINKHNLICHYIFIYVKTIEGKECSFALVFEDNLVSFVNPQK